MFVFSRGGTSGPAYGAAAAQLLEFDPDGKFVREIGRNLYAWSFAHAVRIDKEDNIWAVDKGSDMVIKFNPDGRVMMVFGRKKEASDEADGPWAHPSPPAPPVDGTFRQVTDVTWDPAGNTYISDGYINSRVAKYDADGNWVKSWGEFGTGPGQFRVLHSIQADAEGHLYVADRGNGRIQVFDGDGNLIRIIQIGVPFDYARARAAIGPKPGSPDGSLASYGAALTMAPGAPWALCITPPPNQVLYSADAFPGRIYKMTLDGKVLGVLGETGKKLKQFGWIHEIACPSENELYVAELAQLADPEVDFASAIPMRREQRTRTHVVVDVDVAPFPSCEDPTIDFADLACAGGNSPRGRATSCPSELRDWKSQNRDRANTLVNTADRMLRGETSVRNQVGQRSTFIVYGVQRSSGRPLTLHRAVRLRQAREDKRLWLQSKFPMCARALAVLKSFTAFRLALTTASSLSL